MTLAWLLNLDADDDLGESDRGSPPRTATARVRAFGVRTNLAIEGDVVIEDGVRAEGLEARAWMPTPRALARIVAAGASAPAAPALAILRTVNDRAFAIELGPTLEGAVYARTVDQVLAAVDRPNDSGSWLLKPAHSFAGRGQLVVAEASAEKEARAFAEAAIRGAGGVAIEPRLARTDDFAIHGFVNASGDHLLGAPTRQRCDERGTWRGTELAAPGDLSPEERGAMIDTAERVARALGSAGYFGPFGVDAFRYVDAGGGARFHPLCEINARYTMGYAIGMGPRRPDRGGR